MHEITCFSAHAAQRMAEREISLKAIEETIAHGKPVPVDDGRTMYARGSLRVLINDHGMVVTSYRDTDPSPKRRLQKIRQAKCKAKRRERKAMGWGKHGKGGAGHATTR